MSTRRIVPIARADATHAAASATAADRFLQPGRLRLSALPPLSLYVHFPWCVRKCPYCDFNSHEIEGEIPEQQYLDALRADLEQSLPLVWGRRVHTIFIGGGTPSLLSAAGLDRLLGDIRSRLVVEPDAEITMEANPGTVEAARFAEYAKSGVNRISLGIQSFDDRRLAALGRIHGRDEALVAAEIAMRHFDNVNLDMMYALPDQSIDECRSDLRSALAIGSSHLSLYHLTIEPNTVFAKFTPAGLPDDDSAADMQSLIEDETAAAGFEHYEVSAYARPGRQSRHNVNYWSFGDYLGIGAGAHGKLSFAERVVRQARLKQPASYLRGALDGSPTAEEREVGPDEIGFEFMLNALRLIDGVPAAVFAERTGTGIASVAGPLEEARRRGLMVADPTRIATTPLGMRFLNDVTALFLP
ncbi:radical SAM family heme chaperone HemW [soil metagenome]